MRWPIPVMMALVIAGGLAMPVGDARAADYMPTGAAAKWVSVSPDSRAANQVIVLTVPLPGGASDAGEMAKFGVLYGYSPRTIFVHVNQPTEFSFWNLQSDEQHDLMLTGPGGSVLMHMQLPELKKTKVTLDFHQQGLFNFYCTMHQPYMTGQIFVLPPVDGAVAADPPLLGKSAAAAR